MSNTSEGTNRIYWATRVGVILAVTGSAVGLGNFLRFPGVAAAEGGGVFMVPYIIAFLLLGLPIAWVEWSMGRYGGHRGYNSLSGIFFSISRAKASPYLGVFGLLLPVMVYCYYIYVVGWCLGYAWYYLSGKMSAVGLLAAGQTVPEAAGSAGVLLPGVQQAVAEGGDAFESFFSGFVGATQSGWAYWHPLESPLIFVVIAFVLNFILIYRGITRGIEWFCKWALPLLVVLAVVILVRVLTLGAPIPGQPEQNVRNGLGYMWNPSHQIEKLAPADRNVRAVVAMDVAAPVPIPGAAAGEYRALDVIDQSAFFQRLQEAGWRPLRIEATEPDGSPRPPDPETYRQIRAWLAEEEVEINAVAAVPDWQAGWGMYLIQRWTHEGSRVRMDVQPQQAVLSTPGFIESLLRPRIWLAAAGQIFFSLSVGFGVIVTYASYMRRDDDVALSSVTAAAGNGFCEVVLAGMMIVPAGFIFLGASFVANPPSTFGMGFVALPSVFNAMGGGRIFGFLFFFLLFLAAMTSTISLLQPAIAFFEEGLGLSRRASVALLGLITACGAGFVVYFSRDLVAIDTIDFWTANVGIVLLATIAVIMYGWVLGIDKGMQELRHGAEIAIPGFIRYIIKYVAPLFLIVVFVAWFYDEFGQRLRKMVENPPVGMAVGFMLIVLIFFLLLIGDGVRRWRGRPLPEEVSP